jgi:hypothetical protein
LPAISSPSRKQPSWMFQWTSSFVVTSAFCFAEQARMYEYQIQSFFVATLWENHGELWLWDERERGLNIPWTQNGEMKETPANTHCRVLCWSPMTFLHSLFCSRKIK